MALGPKIPLREFFGQVPEDLPLALLGLMRPSQPRTCMLGDGKPHDSVDEVLQPGIISPVILCSCVVLMLLKAPQGNHCCKTQICFRIDRNTHKKNVHVACHMPFCLKASGSESPELSPGSSSGRKGLR